MRSNSKMSQGGKRSRVRHVVACGAFGLTLAAAAVPASAQCSPPITVFTQPNPPFTNPYLVNGVSRAPIVMVEGQPYTFNFPTGTGAVPTQHPLIFTTDPDGGVANPGTGQITVVQLPGYTWGGHCSTTCPGGVTFTCTPGPLTPTNFYYQCSSHMNLGGPITILRLPIITENPSNVTTCSGSQASFSVAAILTEGGPVAYQWRRNAVPLEGTSANQPTLTIDSVGPADIGVYDCVVSNSCATATSEPATLSSCPADIANSAGLPGCDGGVDINDLLFFLAQFEAGSSAADLDNGTGDGIPDGGVDINDLLFFLARFEAGC